jgi:hypothetical protein
VLTIDMAKDQIMNSRAEEGQHRLVMVAWSHLCCSGASEWCRGQCAGTGFDSLSIGHHSNVHQAGSAAIEQPAMNDNGNDHPQNVASPIHSIKPSG